jgi:hypothetical protein
MNTWQAGPAEQRKFFAKQRQRKERITPEEGAKGIFSAANREE